MIDQIKIFSALSAMDLEQYVNRWLSEHPAISVISTSQSCESGRLYLTIHYKRENNNE